MVIAEKETAVKQAADELFCQQPDWITFYREILGLHGVVRHTFPTREMLAAFEQTRSLPGYLGDAGHATPGGAVGDGSCRAHSGNHRAAAEKPARGACGSRPTSTAPA